MKAARAARAAVLVAAVGLSSARPAPAHLIPADQATLHVVAGSAFVVVAVPVGALHGFDDDGDGLLGSGELARHLDALRAEVDAGIVLSDGVARATTERLDLVLSPDHGALGDGAGYVVALEHARFDRPPEELRVRLALFAPGAAAPTTLKVTRDRAGGEARVEVAALTATAPEHVFFARGNPAAPASRGLEWLAVLALLGWAAAESTVAGRARRVIARTRRVVQATGRT